MLTLTSQSCNESTRLITFVVSRVDSRIVTIRDRTNQEHMNTVHESRSQKHMNTVHEHGSQNPSKMPHKGIVRLTPHDGKAHPLDTPRWKSSPT